MNKIVLIGLLLVGFQTNVEQKILPLFRFVQRFLLSAMFIFGLSITPSNAALIQYSFNSPTFSTVFNSESFNPDGTFSTSDRISGFFTFNDADFGSGRESYKCIDCIDVSNFRISAGPIKINRDDPSFKLTSYLGLDKDGILTHVSLTASTGDDIIGDVQSTISIQIIKQYYSTWYASHERCMSKSRIGDCLSFSKNNDLDRLYYRDQGNFACYKCGGPLDRFTVVQEPSIIALFGLGLVGIGFARRRRS